MHNRAVRSLLAAERGRASTDERPVKRLTWLFAGALLPVLVIAGRLVYLQGVLSVGFYDPQETTVVTWEWAPARCGRILSADGRVLAEDVVRYEVHAHFRWLQEPPEPAWLRSRALARMNRRERRDRDRVLEQERKVLDERRAMWTRLAALTERPPADLDDSRQRIQRRVDRMLAAVERRRRKSDGETPAGSAADESAGRLERIWRTVVTTLTTPPKRGRSEPVVLPEQSDYHRLLDDVSPDVAAEIEAHPELYPGLRVQTSSRRSYPLESLAAHVVGHRSAASRTPSGDSGDGLIPDGESASFDPAKLPPQPTTQGRTGLELTYDSVLRGRPGLRKVIRNSRGEVLETETVREPQSGRDVVVSLDAGLQRQVELLLDEAISRLQMEPASAERSSGVARPPAGGSIVAIDVHTGEVLAAASAPRFDLNVVVEGDPQRWKSLTTDPRRPLFPRAHGMMLPPGSTFKAVTAAAILDGDEIDPDAPFVCQGFLNRPDRHRCYIYRHFGVGHGELNLNDAIARSCNVYFYQAARTMGPKPLVDWADAFGFGSPTGIDLPGEQPGNLPSPFSGGSGGPVQRTNWRPGDTLGLAIGQSRLTATPLQVARMMAVISNGGYSVTPHLLRRVDAASRTRNDRPTAGRFPRERVPGLNANVLAKLQEGLRNVVQHPAGTGYKSARIPGFEYAGKTGTAEVGGGRPDHAWFAGYAPASNPRVAFAVVLEHGGSGGEVAGPVAKRLVQLLRETGRIRDTVRKSDVRISKSEPDPKQE